VSIRSTKRLPSGDAEPKEPFLQSTAFRIVRSASLFVGSTPSTLAKVQRHFSYSMRSLAILRA
jgi:hypothetical protein